MFGSSPPPDGVILSYAFLNTNVLRNFCNSNIALYLGTTIFITMDNFESSLPPLAIPGHLTTGLPSVTSAFFAPGSILLFVVNRKVFIYNYRTDSWSDTNGVKTPVSHISGDSCCYNNRFCLELANRIFVYSRGGSLPETEIYFSDNGGFSFQDMNSDILKRFTGTLGGIFYLNSLSQVGILVVKDKKGTFYYLEHPLNNSEGIPFKYNEYLDVIIKPGQTGFLILYGQLSLMVSPNAGQIMQAVELWKGKRLLFTDISSSGGFTVHSVASNVFELAVFTHSNHLYYGSQSYLKTSVIQLPNPPSWNSLMGISFTDTGMLEFLTPVQDPKGAAFDFEKCTVNVQAVLMNPKLDIEPCNVEVLESTMVNKMFTIDMNTKLDLSALMIPRRGKTPIPLVMVSNPHSLGFEAHTSEFGNTFDGNIKHKLEIELRQQHHWENADINFTSSIKHHSVSSLTVDIADKTLACVDLKPLTTLISIGCDQSKRIIVQNKISACSMGILDPVELQDNYTYIIEKEAYKPVSHEAEAQADLLVYYQYKELGCPRLVYYDKPWKPVVELWKDEDLEEIMNAEYVISEVNGIMTYSYSLTAATANCRSQPQNWSAIRAQWDKRTGHPSLWNRENYVSCHDDNDDKPLLWPEVEYQILGGQTDNKVIFGQRNGIYIFLLTVVDPYYSYCSLNTVFSVYVYGALPMAMFPPVLSIMLLVVTTLLSIWLAYAIPKELSTERGQRFKNFWYWLFHGCFKICNCFWLWDRLRQCLRSRKVKDQPGGLPSQPDSGHLGLDSVKKLGSRLTGQKKTFSGVACDRDSGTQVSTGSSPRNQRVQLDTEQSWCGQLQRLEMSPRDLGEASACKRRPLGSDPQNPHGSSTGESVGDPDKKLEGGTV
ncbi:cation channel sperm-associated protein subunit delta [Microtus oregoni]|uniref:cation channel sperm-associated protein subunit delta n=1 Tax=Microtus oregoni TaxID=111838 RepID=UPI001BB2C0E4|nr:cation channel sperm-associated protein subunit delta [Microtus oregoni]